MKSMHVSLLVVSLLVSRTAGAETREDRVSRRVRPLDSVAEAALAQGLVESGVFRRLVDEIEASDLIVHIVASFALPRGAIGTTRLSAVADQHRYVRIVVEADLSPEDRTAILAHELQHACEIARSPARTNREVRALYLTIGQRVSMTEEAFETEAAIEAGVQVRADLHRRLARSFWR